MRKLFYMFLSFMIVYASTMSAYAASPVGWSVSPADVVMNGATATMNAVRSGASGAMKATIAYKPTASAVGKQLLKGAGGLALLFVVTQKLGEGIDWVLDPANNRVVYTEDVLSGGAADGYPGSKFLYGNLDYGVPYAYGKISDAAGPICAALGYDFDTFYGSSFTRCILPNGSTEKFIINGDYNPDYKSGYTPGSSVPTEKFLPISGASGLASDILSSADAGNVASQDFVKSIAVGALDAGELDAGLDAAAVPVGSTDTPTDTPADTPTDTPAETPYDDSGIKSMLAGLIAAVSGLSDFFDSDPPPETKPEDDLVPVDSVPPTSSASDFDVNYINFGGQCPVLPSFSVGIGAASSSMAFDVTPLCELAVMIRPAIIAMAYFIGLGVIASAIRET